MKRSIGIFLLIVFSVALLAGCSPSADTQSSAPQSASSESPSESGTGTEGTDEAASAEPSGTQEVVLTIEELAAYNGKDGMPAYIAVDGVIYDVTEDIGHWQGGMHNGFSAGADLTQEIKEISPHGVSKLNELTVVGRLAD